MKFDITPFDRFVYRIPLYRLTELYEFGDVDQYDQQLKEFFSRKEIQEAMYLASPDFLEEINRFIHEDNYVEKNERRMNSFRYSAWKYVNRICTRPTPFGLFAGCGIGNIEEGETEIKPADFNHFKRKARLDMNYLESIKDTILNNDIDRKLLKYFANNTIYEVGKEYRYVEYTSTSKGRKHILATVPQNDYLKNIIQMTKYGASYDSLVHYLVNEDIDIENAQEYIDDLIKSKLLLSELEPLLICDDSHDKLFLDKISRLDDQKTSSRLKHIKEVLKQIISLFSAFEMESVPISDYKNLKKELDSLLETRGKHLLQVDSEVIHNKAILSEAQVWDIKKGMKAYFQIASITRQNDKLTAFKKKFIERYDSEPVKLVELLDPELGLNYGKFSDNQLYNCPIIDDIPVGEKKKDYTSLKWDNKLHYYLFNKIINATKANENVEITNEELSGFTFDQAKIPASLIAFLQLIPTEDSKKCIINFKNWGSDSATTILGRFSTLNNEIESLVKEIADHEANCLPEYKKLAEINHLSNPKIGNISARKKFRDLEIPYLTKSNSNDEGLLDINDLYVKLDDNQFKIIDIRSNKQIVPILSNAHNFNKDTMPIYRFLSDIQNESDQETCYMNLSLGDIPRILDYIPRISYKNFVFRLATWKIYKKDFEWIWTIPEKERLENLKKFLIDKNYPLRFYIKSGDNKLFIDFIKIPYPSFLLFTEEISKNGVVLIEEDPYTISDTDSNNNHIGGFCHELIVPFKNNNKLNIHADSKSISLNLNKDRKFFPGSDWVYFKLYAGVYTCEKILNQLSPLIKFLKDNSFIDKWFYLKYSDTGTHLRVRFRVTDKKYIGEVINMFYKYFEELITNKKIKQIIIDTYCRELERYGGDSLIDASESVFCLDSTWCLKFIEMGNEYPILKTNYWLLALKVCDSYMNAFGLSLEMKEKFSKVNRDHFANEFNANKTQKRKMIGKYKENEIIIEQILSGNHGLFPEFVSNQLGKFECQMDDLSKELFIESQEDKKLRLLMSFIHMFLLRYLPAKNRMHEYFIYSVLENYYRIQVGKSKTRKYA